MEDEKLHDNNEKGDQLKIRRQTMTSIWRNCVSVKILKKRSR